MNTLIITEEVKLLMLQFNERDGEFTPYFCVSLSLAFLIFLNLIFPFVLHETLGTTSPFLFCQFWSYLLLQYSKAIKSWLIDSEWCQKCIYGMLGHALLNSRKFSCLNGILRYSRSSPPSPAQLLYHYKCKPSGNTELEYLPSLAINSKSNYCCKTM